MIKHSNNVVAVGKRKTNKKKKEKVHVNKSEDNIKQPSDLQSTDSSPPLPKYNREGTETETETGTQRIKNLKNFGKLLYIFGLRKSQMHHKMLLTNLRKCKTTAHSVLSLSKTEI